MQYQFLAVAFCLMGVVVSRRHLCDDLTLPECTNGDKADYNPTGENRWESNGKKSLGIKSHLQEPTLLGWVYPDLHGRIRSNCEEQHLPARGETVSSGSGQGGQSSSSSSIYSSISMRAVQCTMYTFEQLKCAGHCRALGCLRGWLLPSLPQWKSRHLPFLHQKMCRQVTYLFYI